MARKQTLDAIIGLYKKLGGNTSEVLGTKTNVNFLGKGKSPELMLDMDINAEALGVLPRSKAVEELTSSVGYAVSGKLNDIQASQLLKNMQKMDEVYFPPAAPANIADLATGTRNLDQEGLMSLRVNRQMDADELADFEMQMGDRLEAYDFDGTVASAKKILADDKAYTDEMFAQYKAGKLDPVPGDANREKFLRGKFEEMQASGDKKLMTRDEIEELSAFDDLPPPGSRGGADDIAAPVQDAETTIRNLEAQEAGLGAQFKNIVTNRGDVPGKRASAREFLVEALKKDEYDVGTAAFGKTQLNNIISAEDVKYITEGGGGIGGDPIVLVEKYFGPRIAEALPTNASNEEILIFTKRVLENVVDAAGNKPGDPRFDRFTARFIDEFAEGGKVPAADSQLVKESEGIMGYRGKKGYLPDVLQHGYFMEKRNPRTLEETQKLDTVKDIFNADQPITQDLVDLSEGFTLSPITFLKRLIAKEEIKNTRKTDKADGGRVGLRFGGSGKAFGLAKKLANINKSVDEGTQMGYGALREYGIEAEDISRLFRELAMDRTMVGPEKTEYFKMLNQVLKNPDQFPDGIIEIKKRLGMDFARGGLAKILEV